MAIIGIASGFHDSSCALLEKGKIIYAIAEERLTRIKGDSSFPYLGLKEIDNLVLKNNLSVEALAFFEKPDRRLFNMLRINKEYINTRLLKEIEIDWSKKKKLSPLNEACDLLKLTRNNVKFYYSDHHFSHAAYGLVSSGYKDCVILVIDAIGECSTFSLYQVKKNRMPKLFESYELPFSFGFLYTYFTALLGFKPNEGEFKLMGLASYGRPKYVHIIKEMISWSEEKAEFVLPPFMYAYGQIDVNNQSVLNQLDFNGDINEKSKYKKYFNWSADVASSIQKLLETLVLFYILKHIDLIRKSNNSLVISGGVALNCKLVTRIYNEIKCNLHVPNAPGDCGSSIGSCYSYLWNNNASFLGSENPLISPDYDSTKLTFLGKELEADEHAISVNCLDYGLNYKQEIEYQNTIEALVSGQIGAWAISRSEFGPRALGHRSIICRHDDPKMKHLVNNRVKHREAFRPFAGVFTEEQAERHFDLISEDNSMHSINRLHYSMLCVANSKGLWTKNNSAIIHEDNTCRIQIVNQEDNHALYKLLLLLEKSHGIEGLLNTSLNVNGQPNCEDLNDIFYTFGLAMLDFVTINSTWYVYK